MRGDKTALFVVISLLTILGGTTLSAHRRDEYLQAARLAVEPRRVELQLDLTPGIAIADAVVGDIDRDRDGTLSRDEQQANVKAALDLVELRVDERLLTLQSVTYHFPAVEAVRRGEGTIQIRTSALLPPLAAGDHELAFHNRHHPDASVYLANALVPDGDVITIGAQRRDATQRDLTIAYVVRDREAAATPLWLLGIMGATMVVALRATQRPRP